MSNVAGTAVMSSEPGVRSDQGVLVKPSLATPMLPQVYQIQQRYQETQDVFTLELVPTQGQPPMSFAPGQFNMLYAFGTGESAISISSNPQESDHLWHTIRPVGTVTTALSRLRVGDRLGVRGPFGRGWPLDLAQGQDVLLIAGGLGLAPLRSAIAQILAERHRYGQVALLYGTRTPHDLIFQADLERWQAHPDLELLVTVDRAEVGWQGNVGVVPPLLARVPFDPQQTLALLCGPEGMMRFTILELSKLGLGPEQIYVSLERNMKCAIAFCGHCQLGSTFICRDGPVLPYDRMQHWLEQREF